MYMLSVCMLTKHTRMCTTAAGLKVYTGIIDSEVNANGFILPGLGDAGDRAFGTV